MSIGEVATVAPVAFVAGVVAGYRLHHRYRIVRVSHGTDTDDMRGAQLPTPPTLPDPPDSDVGRQ